METHALSVSQEYTNFTHHFLNVLSSRFQSITHKLSLLTKLYYSYLLTICSQSCYTLKVIIAQWCLTLCDPWTVAHQAPLCMEWSRQGYWSVDCHSFLQGIVPIQGLNPGLLHCRQILYHLSDTLHIIRRETQQQVRACRPKRGEDAPPGTLLTATSSEVRRPPEGQEAKLRHTSPSNRARAVKLSVGIHKGEGAWNLIFLLMIRIKGEQSTIWEKFPAGYLMRDWPEMRVSRADKQCPNSEPPENSDLLPNSASRSKHSLLFSP